MNTIPVPQGWRCCAWWWQPRGARRDAGAYYAPEFVLRTTTRPGPCSRMSSYCRIAAVTRQLLARSPRTRGTALRQAPPIAPTRLGLNGWVAGTSWALGNELVACL